MSIIATEATQERVIRYETQLQRAKRDEFIRTQLPLPIKSLPNELLCQILKTVIETTPARLDPHRVRKCELATVCRHWRDVIVNTPSFWTFVQLAPTWRKALVKAHLKRSRQCPLDLVFDCFYSRSRFIEFLSIVVPTTRRWRSLTISPQPTPIDTLFILEIFDFAKFPLLALLSIPTLPSTNEFEVHQGHLQPIPYYPKFLYPGNLPVLRSLEIRHDFPPQMASNYLPLLRNSLLTVTLYPTEPTTLMTPLGGCSLPRYKA